MRLDEFFMGKRREKESKERCNLKFSGGDYATLWIKGRPFAYPTGKIYSGCFEKPDADLYVYTLLCSGSFSVFGLRI